MKISLSIGSDSPKSFSARKSLITTTLAAVNDFAAKVHAGEIAGPKGRFRNLLVIGIGGSALGPQFVSHALGRPRRDRMAVTFFDNTDPDGFDYVLGSLRGQLARTLVVVISKSGGTVETREWYCQGVGLVKDRMKMSAQMRLPDGNLAETRESFERVLEDYTVAGSPARPER